MVRYYYIFLILFSFTFSFGYNPTASFTTNPAAVNGVISICRTQTVTFTSTVSNPSPTTTYNWQFPGGSITSSTLEGPHVIRYNSAGIFSARLILNNGSSFVVTVEVSNTTPSAPVIALVDGNAWSSTTYNNQTYFSYCSNDANTSGGLFSFTTNSTLTDTNTIHTFDWGDGQTDSYTGTNLSETFHFYAQAGYYPLLYTIQNQNGCSYQRAYNLYVGAIPTATISALGIPTLCNPGSVTYDLLYGAQNTPGTTYTFQVNDGSPPVVFNHPPPATITHQFLESSCGTNSNLNNTLYPNSYQASITVSNPCGNGSNAVGPINIQSAPIANFTRTPAENTICSGTTVAISDSTIGGYNIGGPPNYICTQIYKKYWTIEGPSGNIATANNGSLITNPFITSTNNFGFNNNQVNNPNAWISSASSVLNVTFNLPGNYTITLYTGSNSCGITSISQTICVTPRVIADFTYTLDATCEQATINLTNTSSETGCNNSNSYLWEINGINPENCPTFENPSWEFLSGNANATNPQIQLQTPGVYTISLTTSLQNPTGGLFCSANTKTSTIIVKGKPVTTLTQRTVCQGENFEITPNVFNCYANNSVSYFWDFGSTPPSFISNNGSASPTIRFDSPGIYNYSLTISNECGSNTYFSTITVNPKVIVTASGTSATCVNSSIQLNGSITGGVNSGSWSASIPGGTFLPNNNAIIATYIPPINYTGSITFTLTSDAPAAPCEIVTTSFSTIFNSEAIANTGSYDPICKNSTLSLNGTIGGAAATATWSSNNGGNFSNPNSLSSTFTPPIDFIGTIILTLTTNDPDGPCEAVLDSVEIDVKPIPIIDAIDNIVVCPNENVTIPNFSGINATEFTWTNSNPNLGLSENGNGNINFVALNNTNNPISGIITVTPINTLNEAYCEGLPTTFTITINPPAQVNAISNQVFCNGSDTSIIEFTTQNTLGTTTYNWFNDNPSIGLGESGNNRIPSFTAINTTTEPVTATITVIPTYSYNSIICEGIPVQFTYTINPTVQVNSVENKLFCNNQNVDPIIFSSNTINGQIGYNWTNTNTNIGLPSNGSGPITFTAINTTNAPITSTIIVTPFYNSNNIICEGIPTIFNIIVNPTVQINDVTNITLCNGENSNTIEFSSSNSLGITSYEWTNSNPNIGLPSNGEGNINTFIATNTSNISISGTITVTPKLNLNGIICYGNAEIFTITVNPNANVNNIPDLIYCENTTTQPIVFTSNLQGGINSFEWTNSNPLIGLEASGTGTIPSFITVNSSIAPIESEIIVTPFYENNGKSCSGEPIIFKITINPKPQVNQVESQVICNENTTSLISFSSQNTGVDVNYNWTNSNPLIGLPESGNGDIAPFIATNNTPNPIEAIITVIPVTNNSNCTGDPMTFTISVNPSPQILFSEQNQIICSGEATIPVTITSNTSNVIINWTISPPDGITGITLSGSDNIPTQALINTTNLPISLNYEVNISTNDLAACQSIPRNYTITVLPKPNLSNAEFLLCNNQEFVYNPLNNQPDDNIIVPNNTIYSWTISNNPFIEGASNGNGNLINQTLVNTSATEQTIIYTVVPSYENCIGNSFTIEVKVLPRPDVLFSIPNQVICNNSPSQTVNFSSTISGSYEYTWNAIIPNGITGAIASGTNSIPIQNLINTTSTPLTILYETTATFDNGGFSCIGPINTYSITINPTLFITNTVSNYNTFNVSCAGGNDGFIITNVTGGSGNYTFNWSGPNGFSANTSIITNLIAGNYTLILTDNFCEPITQNFTIVAPQELIIANNMLVQQNVICNGGNNGQIEINITQESVGPYTYNLLLNNNTIETITNTTATNATFTNLIAGDYIIKVIDSNGCFKILNITITEPNEISTIVRTTPISCYGANDASISLEIAGGIAPYIVNWSNLATGTLQNNLSPGIYIITITDAVGCIKIVQQIINNLPIFEIQPVITQITCNGANNGRIDLGLVGGQNPITVTWSDGSNAGLIRNNLSAGQYNVVISDASNCPINRTFTIIEPEILNLEGNVQNDLNCNSTNNGSINLIVSGGTAPYQYNWSNGATTEDLFGLSNGNYNVIVTDARGCSATKQFTVFRPNILTVSLNTDRNVNCNSGIVTHSFEAIVNGGVPPYQISWSNGNTSGPFNQYMTTNQNGLITVTVLDARGCFNTANYNINNSNIGQPFFENNSYFFSNFGEYSVDDPIEFINLSDGDIQNVYWNFGDGQFSSDMNPFHTYVTEGSYTVELNVTYAYGCIKKFIKTINITKGYKLIVPNGFTANNDTINDNFAPAFEGLKSLQLSIYDSWGNLIFFEEGDNLAGWNGTINNIPAENGNYYYKLSASTFFGKKIEQNGAFVLLK